MAVKLEAIDFTDWSVVQGNVATLGRDSLDPGRDCSSDQEVEGKAAAPSQVYAARIRLACGLLSPGARRCATAQDSQAEIKTGSRRIIDYLL